MNNQNRRERNCAIIVTFNPTADVTQKIVSLSRQVDLVYFIDNSLKKKVPVIEAKNVVWHWNGNQGGLAGALNFALNRARDSGVKYAFLFDQDTDIPDTFCSEMLLAHDQHKHENYGIFGPRHVNSSTEKPVRLGVPDRFMCSYWPNKDAGIVEALFLINSCSMLDLSKLPKDLHYDEDMAVDMIDIDFCLAARARGVKCLCIAEIEIMHGIGNRKEGSFIFSPTNYNSHRKYLQTRNRLVVWAKYRRAYPHFVFSDGLIWTMDSIRTVCFESGRWGKFKAILQGIVDGIKLAKQQPKIDR